ncbi:MAG: cell division protein FtsB [Thiothrix sp.]|nr:MAG: cell division protein FtsB [Thiothrix sp.]
MLSSGTLCPSFLLGDLNLSMKLTLNQIILIGLALLSLFLFIRLWLGTGSYPEIWDLKGQIAEQQKLNEEQATRNARLESDVIDISRDDATIEDRARSELGMIKQNETYYQVILNSDPNPAPVAATPIPSSGTPAHVE